MLSLALATNVCVMLVMWNRAAAETTTLCCNLRADKFGWRSGVTHFNDSARLVCCKCLTHEIIAFEYFAETLRHFVFVLPGHYGKENLRSGGQDMHNFISSGFVTLGRGHLKGSGPIFILCTSQCHENQLKNDNTFTVMLSSSFCQTSSV